MIPYRVRSGTGARRALNKFEEQFPDAIDLIARALRAGHAFTTGLGMVADEIPDPVGPEFQAALRPAELRHAAAGRAASSSRDASRCSTRGFS